MQVVVDFFSNVIHFCYELFSNYGWAIILFTLLSKIVLFPVSIWVQKNSIKMVRIQPEINELKLKHYGDKDTIAEKQAELMKREKYNAFADIIPMLIQVALLLAMIAAIKQGMEMPGMNLSFLGIQLNEIPAQQGGWLYLIPLVAGLTSYALCVVQNKYNVVQENSSKGLQIGTMTVSVGISLFLGFFVQVGVAVYWVASNIFSIVTSFLLNWMINPRKHVDYERLEKSRKALEELDRLGNADMDPKEAKALRKREKGDYKRFFSVANKHLVFYSESNGFYKYFGPVLDEIFKRSNLTVHYITSDPKDKIFELSETNPKLKAYYIGQRRLITLMMKMDADVVVMTMSDLENYHYKRSYVRKDVRYIYMFHYPLSTHMVLHTGALDHYDEILCVGDFQIPEIRKSEELAGLPAKKLEVCGYCQLDSLYKAYMNMEKKENDSPRVLIAPSWQDDNILDSCIDELLKSLLGHGWQVKVRPHPEYMKRYKPRMDSIIERWKDYQGTDLSFETDFTSNESIYASDVVITDWSGTATEFSFITLRPCIFINTPPKINNPEYVKLGIEPQELRLRNMIGIPLEINEIGSAGESVQRMLDHATEWTDKIRNIRDELIANFPDSAPVSARAILNAVVEKQKANK